MFTSTQIIKYLSGKPDKNIEFINYRNKNIHVFRCRDGSVRYGEIGDGAIYDFNNEKFKNDLWILSFNPYV